MKKNCNKCKAEYENVNFCPNCGQKLTEINENKIDESVNKIDEKFKKINEKTDAFLSNVSNEVKNSETVKKALVKGYLMLTALILIIGVFGVTTLLVQLISVILTHEPSILARTLHPTPNATIYDDLYNASFDVKFERLLPTIILPSLAIFIAGLKKPIFFIFLILVLILAFH